MALTIYRDHSKITKRLEKECMNTDELAKKTNLDKTLIMDHLAIKELDRNGGWTSEDGEFCSYDVIVKFLSRLKEAS